MTTEAIGRPSEPPGDDQVRDRKTGRFKPGFNPRKYYNETGNNGGGRTPQILLTAANAWEWARGEKHKVIRALVQKAIKGHHPSIELYLAYVDGRPVQEFKSTSLSVSVSGEDIRELAEKLEANRIAFAEALGLPLPEASQKPALLASVPAVPTVASPSAPRKRLLEADDWYASLEAERDKEIALKAGHDSDSYVQVETEQGLVHNAYSATIEDKEKDTQDEREPGNTSEIDQPSIV